MLKKEVQSKEELYKCYCPLTEQYVDFIVELNCTCDKLVKNAQMFVPFAPKTFKRYFYEQENKQKTERYLRTRV